MNDRSQPLPSRDRLISRCPPEPDRRPRALELGCSTGCYLKRLQADGWDVTGVEPGATPAAIARASGLDVHCGFLEDAPLQPESFEAVAVWQVIEHVLNPRQTLTHLYQLLKPGGQLLIGIPNVGCWEPAVFGRYWYGWELPRHLHHFTPQSMTRLLQECGFEKIQVTHQRAMLNVVGSLGIAILSAWPDSRPGKWLKYYPDHPTVAGQLLLAPFAHILAWLRQGGRLTIAASRPLNS